ncbi:hypothetical protein RD055328_10130 [Companilactobacillus sp. RD055328]|uniref:hypothetical protein n=1 Tax=Companilactobacillus sp. RD055328 TaxID=2916634 RepID=UPI001FC83AA3|nr:hypothetical protein [Companilactobacillus sp. RD055328]GKQ43090.1 hypothetical protein RD055328_10130 [Companilactobacillus sp. RD055328]
MPINLTLGTKKLLSDFSKPYLLLYPIKSDESILRVELTGLKYQEVLKQNFDWHFTYYKFIYLNFNSDQASIFANKFVNKKYMLSDFNILILNEIQDINKFVVVIGSNSPIKSQLLDSTLKELATNELGMFSKNYVKRQDNDKNSV